MSNLHMNQFFIEVFQQTDIILYNITIFEVFIFFQFKYLQIFKLRGVEVLFEYSSMIASVFELFYKLYATDHV